MTAFENENFSLYSDNGFKRIDDGDTQMFYNSMLANRQLTPQIDIYLKAATGAVISDHYEDSRLQSLAFGMFYDGVLRSDDSYHVRLQQPFAAKQVADWELAADARFGEADNYIRLGISHKLQGDKTTKAGVFWARDF